MFDWDIEDGFEEELDIIIKDMKQKSQRLIFKTFLEILACGLAWYFFGWQMMVILFIFLWASKV